MPQNNEKLHFEFLLFLVEGGGGGGICIRQPPQIPIFTHIFTNLSRHWVENILVRVYIPLMVQDEAPHVAVSHLLRHSGADASGLLFYPTPHPQGSCNECKQFCLSTPEALKNPVRKIHLIQGGILIRSSNVTSR